jgi:hypothetical protein
MFIADLVVRQAAGDGKQHAGRQEEDCFAAEDGDGERHTTTTTLWHLVYTLETWL